MKDMIVNLFDKADQFLETYLGPVVEKIVLFLIDGKYTIYALIGVFLLIVILIGLIRWIFKGTKSFIAILILFGIVFTIWMIFAN